ncbi:hypothetical protein JTB14_003471 [Gonioctena quinquepunctata]|nr:hypothetical protein JTB14_003471 [Gonioctena quinquepunctata]
MNVKKCKVCSYTRNANAIEFFYSFDQILSREKAVRDLSVMFDSRLTIVGHTSTVVASARKIIGSVLRNCQRDLDCFVLELTRSIPHEEEDLISFGIRLQLFRSTVAQRVIYDPDLARKNKIYQIAHYDEVALSTFISDKINEFNKNLTKQAGKLSLPKQFEISRKDKPTTTPLLTYPSGVGSNGRKTAELLKRLSDNEYTIQAILKPNSSGEEMLATTVELIKTQEGNDVTFYGLISTARKPYMNYTKF